MKGTRLLLFLGVLILAACARGRAAAIKDRLESLNYCETTADCIVVAGKCPFDCYIPTFQKNAEHVQHILERYESTCTYSCLPQPPVECSDGRCVLSDANKTPDTSSGASLE